MRVEEKLASRVDLFTRRRSDTLTLNELREAGEPMWMQTRVDR